MKNFALRLSLGVAALLAVGPAIPALAQDSPSQSKGIPYDWSHHRMVFSNPGTFEEAVKNGTYDQWQRIVTDPRFQQQQLRRGAKQWQASAVAAGDQDDLVLPAKSKTKKLKKDWSMDMGSLAKVGADQYPAVFAAYTQANCDNASQPDFAAFNTSLAGSGTQASIIAYDNLYSSCGGSIHPLVYFQYNTNAGTISTSVALAADGIQMAFINTVGGIANLAVLKSKRNVPLTNASIVTLNSTSGLVTPALYRNCTAPCMTEIALSGNPTVTYSAPYYDFGSDSIYVGDDLGVLHKFTNIFNSGAPAEITGGGAASGWPQNISSAAGGATDQLTSPVYDSNSGNVLVNITGIKDSKGAKVARISAAGGSSTIVISAQVGDPAGYGFYDGPLVDGTAGKFYSFLDADAAGPDNAAVFQFGTLFGLSTAGVEQTLGVGNTVSTQPAYDGTFDNIYYSSGTPNNPSGDIYACGRTASGNNRPTLYQISFTSNSFASATVTTGPLLATSAGNCSPVAEFFNTSSGVDWIFLGQSGTNRTVSPISCPSGTGCIMNFDVTTASGFSSLTTTTSTSLETSGTSGIVVDNALSIGGASNIYFSPLGNQFCAGNTMVGSGTGGCAIQATQAAP